MAIRLASVLGADQLADARARYEQHGEVQHCGHHQQGDGSRIAGLG